MQFTVIICTYCREELLANTLATLSRQDLPGKEFEVLVVDNAGRPATEAVARNYGVLYVIETTVGLSHARNRGIRESATPWVLYLDDDIRAPPDLLSRFHQRLATADYAALGGQFSHWFATPPPTWLLKYFGSPMAPAETGTFGELPADRFLYGGVMAVSREALSAVGGFLPELGMRGQTPGFGEEDELQGRLRKQGFRIFYDPAITIEHLVQPYKYRLDSQLGMAYAHGQASVYIDPPEERNRWNILLLRSLEITTVSVPFNIGRWMLKPGYVWQHAFLDSLKKYWFAFGRFRASR